MEEKTKIAKLTTTDAFGREFVVYGTAENPLFLAKDVAETIDYSKTSKGRYNVAAMLLKVDDDEKLVSTILISGQNRDVWFLTENGLYEVLMQSRKPIAKEFKKVVKKLLKDIRTGKATVVQDEFAVVRELVGNPRNVAKLCDLYADALDENKRLAAEVDEKNGALEAQLPLVEFAKLVETSENAVPIGTIAKLIAKSGVKIGRDRFFQILRRDGWLCSRPDRWNEPAQKGLDAGYFVVKERVVERPKRSPIVYFRTYITGKGQRYFVDKYGIQAAKDAARESSRNPFDGRSLFDRNELSLEDDEQEARFDKRRANRIDVDDLGDRFEEADDELELEYEG